jgi:DNA polymerase III delta prime subunit
MQNENNELFINKYQPQKINEFLMEQDILELIHILIKMDHFNLLFIGESGSGKTSMINVIVKEYYENVSEKNMENNILTISSLKEQGIHYYRNELKIFCQTKSSIQNKKKMVIIDDIDMLNEQCQQIIRNYIDHYSNNVHFLASSYSIQKVLESLQSRFIIIRLNSLSKDQMILFLKKIQEKENIILEPSAEAFLIKIVNYNLKTLINYMEKFKLLDLPFITLDITKQLSTSVNFVVFEKYIDFIKNNDLDKAVKLIYSIYDKGYTVMDILDCFFLFVKTTDCLKEEEKYKWIPLICKYITIFHTIHEEELELALFTNESLKVFS